MGKGGTGTLVNNKDQHDWIKLMEWAKTRPDYGHRWWGSTLWLRGCGAKLRAHDAKLTSQIRRKSTRQKKRRKMPVIYYSRELHVRIVLVLSFILFFFFLILTSRKKKVFVDVMLINFFGGWLEGDHSQQFGLGVGWSD